MTTDERSATVRCPHCGADGGSDGFCEICGATLAEQPNRTALAPGARFVVGAETIELVRREIEGDWSARSESGKYYLVSEWNTPQSGAPEDLVPAPPTDAVPWQDTVPPASARPLSGAGTLLAPVDVPEQDPNDEAAECRGDTPDLGSPAAAEGEIAQAAEAQSDTDEAASVLAASPTPVEDAPPPAAAKADAGDGGIDVYLKPVEPLGDALRRVVDFLSTVRHPSLPASFLVGRHPHLPVDILFTEYDPTGDWLTSLTISPAQACRVGGQLAQLLSTSHAAGTSLVGLRPAAVRWSGETSRATVVRVEGVSAFGSSARPRTWGVATAPEILIGDPITPAADVYSLGSLLASSLGMSLGDVEDVPSTVREIGGEVHLDLSSLVMRCMSSTPADRPGLQHVARELGRLRGASDVLWAAESSIGRVRDVQEDSWAGMTLSGAAPDSSVTLVAVADGMGGAAAGEIASRLAVRALAASFTETLTTQTDGHLDLAAVDSVLTTAFASAATAVNSHAEAFPESSDLGTTLTAACIVGGWARIVHVGDSRLYLVRGGSLSRITTDHTVVARLIEIDELTEEEAASHPQRDILYRSLGGSWPVEPQIAGVELHDGDWLILTTDGVHGLVANDKLVQATTLPTPAVAARRLVSEAILAGGRDNATAVCIRILSAAP